MRELCAKEGGKTEEVIFKGV